VHIIASIASNISFFYALNRSRQTGIKSMKLETMIREYYDMYKEINLSCGL